MGMNDSFSTITFRILVTAISLAVMLPVFLINDGVSFYATISVFALGKLVDSITKITNREHPSLYWWFFSGIVVSILAVSMCFFAFASLNMPESDRNPQEVRAIASEPVSDAADESANAAQSQTDGFVVSGRTAPSPFSFLLLIIAVFLCLVDVVEYFSSVSRIRRTQQLLRRGDG